MSVTISGTNGIDKVAANSVESGDIASGAVSQTNLASGVAGNGPAFRAHNNATQSISQTTYTKVLFQVEDFDTASCFASSRFTPNVAGYYQVNAVVSHNFSGANGGAIRTLIYKNGTAQIYSQVSVNSSAGPYGGVAVSDLLYLNGSTDYVEVYAWNTNATPTIDTNEATTFSASLARAA